jgi:hypothetical protein
VDKGADILARLNEQRRAEVARLLAPLEQIKICCGCSGVHAKDARICGECGAYRFETDPAVVGETIRLLGERCYSLSTPVLPRI